MSNNPLLDQLEAKYGGQSASSTPNVSTPNPNPTSPTVPSAPTSNTSSTSDNPIIKALQDAGVQPEQKQALVKEMTSTAEQHSSIFDKFKSGAKNLGLSILGATNPVAKTVLQTEQGKKAAGRVGTGVVNIAKESAKPFLQPFVTTAETITGKPQEFMGVKSSPTPGEALSEAASAALWQLPVEKVITPVMKPLGKLLGGIAERLGGTLTGKGTEVIKEIVNNPSAALKGLKGDEVQVLKDLAQEARTQVSTLNKQMQSEYKQMLSTLPTEEKIVRSNQAKNFFEGRTPENFTGKVTEGSYKDEVLPQLNSKGLKSFITKGLKAYNVVVDRTKNILDFTESPLRKSEEGILREIFGTINKWKDLSPEGVDRLAVKIGNYRKAGDQSPILNSIIGGVKKDVRNYIGDRYPQIAKQVAKYADQADVVETLSDVLHISSGKGTPDVLDTIKAIQNLFTGNKQVERSLLKEMGLGDMVATEAGRQVSSAPTKASASVGDLTRNLVQTVINPQKIGEIAAYLGMAPNKVKPIFEAMKGLVPAERQALFNLFKASSGSSNQEQYQSTNEVF